MVYQIIQSKYRIFIETLILTILILFIGIIIGFYVESSRTNKIISDYKVFEINALDLRLGNYYYQIMSKESCDIAINENLIFADKIYSEGLLIEKYEQANDLSQNILLEKQRYVLLKNELWLNSILLKEKCGNRFNTLVYLYSQDKSQIKKAEQQAISDVLKEIKSEKGNKVILIPIAGDLGLNSVEMQMRLYNVTYLPSIIIDEKKVLEGFQSKEAIEKYLN